MAATPNDFEAFFRKADLDGDGQISGAEAIAFFQGSGLPKTVLAQVWAYADQRKAGYLGQQEFYNALRLVTVAQSQRSLTPDIVKAALYGPAASKIPAPKIDIASAVSRQAPSSSMESLNTSSSLPQSSTIRPQSTSLPHHQMTGSALSNPPVARNQPLPFGIQPRGIQPEPSSANMFSGSTIRPEPSQIRPSIPLNKQLVAGVTTPVLPPAVQSKMAFEKAATITPVLPNPLLSKEQGMEGPKTSANSVNGNSSESLFGDSFSATSVKQVQINAGYSSAQSKPSSSPVIVPGGLQPLSSSGFMASLPGTYSQQTSSVLLSESENRKISDQNLSSVQQSISSSFQPPWPKMSSNDINKYMKVFLQVDNDRDGKITGEQARNLFLSWRLPREILKQIWDLSDQDNDNMLTLKEFCVAVYLMERYRDGRALPVTVPNSVLFDETLLSAINHASTFFSAASGKPTPVTRHPQAIPSSRAPSAASRPPRPPVPHTSDDRQASYQKPTMPSVEKALLNQLSEEEQNTLNVKLQEVSEADKKVGELEKEISESRQKIEFFRAKMQELIIYKSRCDNRLNEISARVSSDRREADDLAKKYEEKCKKSGDVASRLSLEEATFRDIQEKKMELYKAIVNMEEGNPSDDVVKERAGRIQSGLEELMKSLNERCKLYGLRSNPTSLFELPFGWQPGLQEGAADLDEDWDKFEDEGFTYVKELTLEVPNVTASPKKKSSVRIETTSTNGDGHVQSPTIAESTDSNEKSIGPININNLMKSPPGSPTNDTHDIKSPSNHDSPLKSSTENFSPRDSETQRYRSMRVIYHKCFIIHTFFCSEIGVSGRQTSNDHGWNSFDTFHDDPFSKEIKMERPDYDISGLGLNPIKTMFQSENRSLFADSAPSTPAYDIGRSGFSDSVSGTPSYSRNIFADSVPSTPGYIQGMNSGIFADSVPTTRSFNNSPRRFDSFSRFDSLDIHDGGLFQSSNPSLSRFDSMRSSAESDFGYGFGSQYDNQTFSRFDSFSSTDQGKSFSRFDSFRDSDQSDPFPSKFDTFSSRDFDETDPFGSGGPFKSTPSFDSETARKTQQ